MRDLEFSVTYRSAKLDVMYRGNKHSNDNPRVLLSCIHVFHTCCSKWDGGNGEAVSDIKDQGLVSRSSR